MGTLSSVGYTDFYSAETAHQIAVGGGAPLGVILTEINYIKTQIDTAAPTGGLSLTLAGVTPMTQSQTYYEAWMDPADFQDDAHNVARSRMNAVIAYFQRLGYSVKRAQAGTGSLIQWEIKWG